MNRATLWESGIPPLFLFAGAAGRGGGGFGGPGVNTRAAKGGAGRPKAGRRPGARSAPAAPPDGRQGEGAAIRRCPGENMLKNVPKGAILIQ